jgi:hypothetical protein
MLLFETQSAKPAVPMQWVDQDMFNEYGEECVPVVFSTLRQVLRYRCKAECWKEAHTAWELAYCEDRQAPQPFPAGHCMFVNPADYDAVPWK